MPLKTKTARLHKAHVAAYLYRIPLPVREVLAFSGGTYFPICPRCDSTIDREYMCFCDRCGQRLAWELFDFARVVQAPRRKR